MDRLKHNKPLALSEKMLRPWTIALAILLIAGCTQQIAPQVQSSAESRKPADFPEAYYLHLEESGGKVLRVDASRSLVMIEVRSAGALSRLGHDHVVASHDVQGYVAREEGRADLYFRLDRLVVDEPAMRAAAGLEGQLPDEAIDGTRRNMLEKVLEVERFPFALVRIDRLDANASTMKVSITLHGTTRTFAVPVKMETQSKWIAASGQMSFNQTDFGIVPLSILGGALQVQDRIAVRFRIIAGSPSPK